MDGLRILIERTTDRGSRQKPHSDNNKQGLCKHGSFRRRGGGSSVSACEGKRRDATYLQQLLASRTVAR